MFIMRDKLKDTKDEVKKARKKFQADTKTYKREVGQQRAAKEAFNAVMKKETEKTWRIGQKKNQNKLKTLMEKSRQTRSNQNQNDIQDTRAIMYKDRELDQMLNERNSVENIEVYGGVEINENVKKILSKEPGFMIHANIDEVEIEVEIEKGMAKARYELMSRGEEEDGEE